MNTAWALLALIAAQCSDAGAVQRGVRFLVEAQLADGNWTQERISGWSGSGKGSCSQAYIFLGTYDALQVSSTGPVVLRTLPIATSSRSGHWPHTRGATCSRQPSSILGITPLQRSAEFIRCNHWNFKLKLRFCQWNDFTNKKA